MRLRHTVERAVPAGVAAVAAAYLYAGFTREFVVAPLTRAIVRYSPDAVVTFAITELGALGQDLVLASAVAAAVALFAATAAVAVELGHRAGHETVGAPVGAILAFALGWLLVGAWEVGAITGASVALVLGAFVVPIPGDSAPGAPRRRVLRATAGVAASAGLGSVLASSPTGETEPESTVSDPVAGDLLDAAESRSLALPDADPLVSRSFYEVDVSVVNPRISEADWSMAVTGDGVDASYDLADLREFDTEHRFVTLRCVGEPLNGKKMDTALWTGVRVADVLDDAGAPADCCVMARAEDDYYEEFPYEALRTGVLAFRMNGRPLPRAHGAPVRLLVPGHWGEINVKWLTELELLDEPATGYWEERGWHGTGPVNTVAKIHHANRAGDTVTVGGHAYAGTRGVSAVEVSTDGGETWTDAEISDRLPGARDADGEQLRETAEDAWRQWRYEFEANEEVEVVARAIEADGTVQPEEREDSFPSGPSGWVTKTV